MFSLRLALRFLSFDTARERVREAEEADTSRASSYHSFAPTEPWLTVGELLLTRFMMTPLPELSMLLSLYSLLLELSSSCIWLSGRCRLSLIRGLSLGNLALPTPRSGLLATHGSFRSVRSNSSTSLIQRGCFLIPSYHLIIYHFRANTCPSRAFTRPWTRSLVCSASPVTDKSQRSIRIMCWLISS